MHIIDDTGRISAELRSAHRLSNDLAALGLRELRCAAQRIAAASARDGTTCPRCRHVWGTQGIRFRSIQPRTTRLSGGFALDVDGVGSLWAGDGLDQPDGAVAVRFHAERAERGAGEDLVVFDGPNLELRLGEDRLRMRRPVNQSAPLTSEEADAVMAALLHRLLGVQLGEC